MDPVYAIIQYSKYYGDMIWTAQKLHKAEENYAAMLILFNAMELIFKSIRGNFNQSFNQDVKELHSQGMLSDSDYEFINNENGLRKIRNIMTHRDAYQHCLAATDGKAYPFSEADTWELLYNSFATEIVQILGKVVSTQLLCADE